MRRFGFVIWVLITLITGVLKPQVLHAETCVSDAQCTDGVDYTVNKCVGGQCQTDDVSCSRGLDGYTNISDCCEVAGGQFPGTACPTGDLSQYCLQNNGCNQSTGKCEYVQLCPVGYACDAGTCVETLQCDEHADCADGNPNTINVCAWIHDACEDFDCASQDLVPGRTVSLCCGEDLDAACTDLTDQCLQATCYGFTCVYTSISDCCVNNTQCEEGQFCSGTTHVCIDIPSCDDTDICSVDQFNFENNQCDHVPVQGCCNYWSDCFEMYGVQMGCQNHGCVLEPCTTDADCADGDPNTFNACDPSGGGFCTHDTLCYVDEVVPGVPIPLCCGADNDVVCPNLEQYCLESTCNNQGECQYSPISGCCKDDDDCTDGRYCSGQQCVFECDNSNPCGVGEICSNHECTIDTCQVYPEDITDNNVFHMEPIVERCFGETERAVEVVLAYPLTMLGVESDRASKVLDFPAGGNYLIGMNGPMVIDRGNVTIKGAGNPMRWAGVHDLNWAKNTVFQCMVDSGPCIVFRRPSTGLKAGDKYSFHLKGFALVMEEGHVPSTPELVVGIQMFDPQGAKVQDLYIENVPGIAIEYMGGCSNRLERVKIQSIEQGIAALHVAPLNGACSPNNNVFYDLHVSTGYEWGIWLERGNQPVFYSPIVESYGGAMLIDSTELVTVFGLYTETNAPNSPFGVIHLKKTYHWTPSLNLHSPRMDGQCSGQPAITVEGSLSGMYGRSVRVSVIGGEFKNFNVRVETPNQLGAPFFVDTGSQDTIWDCSGGAYAIVEMAAGQYAEYTLNNDVCSMDQSSNTFPNWPVTYNNQDGQPYACRYRVQ